MGLRADISKFRSMNLKGIGKMGPLHLVNDLKTKSTLAVKQGDKLDDLYERVNKSRAAFKLSAREQLNEIRLGNPLFGPANNSPGARLDKAKMDTAKRKFLGKRKKKKSYEMSAREELDQIITLGDDPRPRNKLGMFTQPGAEGGPNPNEVDIVYKPGYGRDLAGGAAAGVGAVTGGGAIKALLSKLGKLKSKV